MKHPARLALPVLLAVASLAAHGAQGSQWINVFHQDFGGNSVNDPTLPQTSTLSDDEIGSAIRFSGNAAMAGVYYLTKQSTDNSDWHKGSDHTYPNDTTRGYYMRVNPNGSKSNDVMYVHRLSGICQGVTFKFSAFVSNLRISETGARPHLGIGIYADKEGTTLVSPNASKDITLNRITDATSAVLPWQELSLEFQMNNSSGTAYFIVCAIQPETNGFDFAIDDITIEVLHPTVNITNLDEFEFGQTVRLAADFENDGYFSNMDNVIYKWYYSADGSGYYEIYASSYTASKSFVLPIQYFDKDKDNGYYRVKIGESGSFESDICSIQGDFRVNETRNKKLVCLRHGEYNAEYNISADDPDIYDGMEIDINSSLTIIIRIIKPRTQTVTFDENGGTCAVETNAYAIGEQYGWLPEAAWQGHMFLGWWAADPDGAGEVPVATTNIVTEESARTLWARWAVLPSVSNVVARQRWPWNGLVDVDYEVGGSTNLLAGVTARITFEERIEGGTGRIWIASNFLAGAEPSVEPGPHRATWDTAADGATNVVAAEVVATVALVREEPIVYNEFFYEIGGESAWSVPHPLYGKDRDGKYLGYYYLDSEFKFRPNAGDWNGDYEFAGEGRIADNGGANCPAPEPSFYRIQVDLADGTYALEAVRSITMVGTHNGWNQTDLATHMSFDLEEGCWTIDYTFAEQTSLKFAMNDDWSVSWGGANGDASNYGDLTENNGKDLSVASGKYRIKLYLSREGSNRVAFVPKE